MGSNPTASAKMKYLRSIVEYYDKSSWLYRYFWDKWALHHGLYLKDNIGHFDSLRAHYDLIIKYGKLNKKSVVLDAGCGVGDGVVNIAKKKRIKVWGITLAESQVEVANKRIIEEDLEELATVEIGNYEKTRFKSGKFDLVYGIESFCHATSYKKLANETWRILKPGGRVVVIDGFLKREPQTISESEMVNDFVDGWYLKSLKKVTEMVGSFEDCGFTMVKVVNLTKQMQQSTWRMKLLGYLGKIMPFKKEIRDNAKALLACARGVESGLFEYSLLVAEK